MGLDIDVLAEKMEKLFKNTIIEEKMQSLENLKYGLYYKKELIKKFINNFDNINKGKLTDNLLGELLQIEEDFNQLHKNFDDKLMIFIIGNGNVGKSTLLNSLIGYPVAETNFLPNTWKIDVYSPEDNIKSAKIIYLDGKEEIILVDEAKDIIDKEEKKSKDSKSIYNEKFREKSKELKTKDEKEEMKKYLGEKYLYKSNIAEVRWPVKKNWLLEKCLLVDTPGLNQNLHDLKQLGNINDYYHKADGVLWLLDGNTIAAKNTDSFLKELESTLSEVGGVRDNIIGVINRIDLVKKNGGDEAIDNVIKDANAIFQDKFYKMVGVSAKLAFEGIGNQNDNILNESGILDLQNAIREIFMSKSEVIKNNAKVQGHNQLLNIINKKTLNYKNKITEYEELYIKKDNKLKDIIEKFKLNLCNELTNFFDNYLDEVRHRVDIYINELSNGARESFIKNTMYKLDDLIKNIDKFIANKENEIKNNSYTWEKMCRISEYKYINEDDLNYSNYIALKSNLEFNSLSSIEYFAPSSDGTLFSFLGNLLGKGVFWLQKNSIKNKINQTIRNNCIEMYDDIIKRLNNSVDIASRRCDNILNSSFSYILCDFKELEFIKASIEDFERNIKIDIGNIELKDVIL